MAQAKLSTAARAFRAVHALVTGAFLLAIGYVWWCALTGRPGLGAVTAAGMLVLWYRAPSRR